VEWLTVTAGLVAILLVTIGRDSLSKRATDSPYTQHVTLFSPAETAFLRVIDQAVGKHYRIFGKIRVADVIDVRQDLGTHAQRTAFRRISAKHFDFVLCNRRDFSIVGVIELNDSSHQRKERALRDAFLINICNAIGLPILTVRVRRQYSAGELRSVIERVFARPLSQ
jgi:hypothetical protein